MFQYWLAFHIIIPFTCITLNSMSQYFPLLADRFVTDLPAQLSYSFSKLGMTFKKSLIQINNKWPK